MRHSRCEMTAWTGLTGCPARAVWKVAVGTRKLDAQLSCGRHLNRTCESLVQAEFPRKADLTITRV